MAGLTLLSNARAETTVADDVSYELIDEWDGDKLNSILTGAAPEFFDIKVDYTPATNDVKLYRITYSSIVPEKDNQPIRRPACLPFRSGTRLLSRSSLISTARFTANCRCLPSRKIPVKPTIARHPPSPYRNGKVF